ncbi:MAG: DUF4445 domain-containing protein [Clostridia bacterium]|nr:DUF4445 domain-containing protein [Clostridia bacterium]
MSSDTKKAVVTTENEIYTVDIGTRLDAALGLPLACGGHGRCGKCKVTAHGSLSPLSESEQRLLTAQEIADGVRLACRAKIMGNCRVEKYAPHTPDLKIMLDGTAASHTCLPAFKKYAIAIDIGTTTLAARLYDTNGKLIGEGGGKNPQVAWGADVVSRIEASVGGQKDALARSIRDAVDKLIQELASSAGICTQDIDGLVITGNTAMLVFLTRGDAEPMSHAPFCPEEPFGRVLTAGELGLTSLHPDTQIYLPPCISAFVGADMLCAVLAVNMCESDETSLLSDIGTNGEMGLWHNGVLRVCSTAAGPAFEGAMIEMGMNGSAGAVDHVTLCNGKPAAHVIGECAPVGICGSGLIDAVACLLDCEELDESGYLEDGSAVITPPVILTQKDIRMVQLAKSAICAGITTLISAAGIDGRDIDKFYIAGGFGSYLNIKNAGRIGLVPPSLTDRATAVGNAALAGASMLLLDTSLRRKALDMSKNATLTDLASSPVFSEAYMRGMRF